MKATTLKVFAFSYDCQSGRGAFDERHAVVVANTESEGLGLVLQSQLDTYAEDWTALEIDTTEPGVDLINSRCS